MAKKKNKAPSKKAPKKAKAQKGVAVPRKRKLKKDEIIARRDLKPWERQLDEPDKAFASFQTYIGLPTRERSVRVAGDLMGMHTSEARRKSGHGPASMEKMSIAWNWVRRAQAYDDHMFAVGREEQERMVRKAAREHKTKVLDIGITIQEKIVQMLAMPLTQQTVEQETKDEKGNVVQRTVVINPTNWNLRDVAALLAQWDKTTRLALGEPTERTESSMHILNEERLELILSDAASRESLRQIAEQLIDVPGAPHSIDVEKVN